MIPSIGFDDFESEVIEERRPVLVACIYWGSEFKEQTEALKSISKSYREALKICLLGTDSIGALREKLGIGGTPTFLIFYEGEEKGRILGRADSDTLRAFVIRTLSHFQDDGSEAGGMKRKRGIEKVGNGHRPASGKE